MPIAPPCELCGDPPILQLVRGWQSMRVNDELAGFLEQKAEEVERRGPGGDAEARYLADQLRELAAKVRDPDL